MGTWRLSGPPKAGLQVHVASAPWLVGATREAQACFFVRGWTVLAVTPTQPSCLSPRSFVFLQLYHSPFFGDESNKPILLPNEVGGCAFSILQGLPGGGGRRAMP